MLTPISILHLQLSVDYTRFHVGDIHDSEFEWSDEVDDPKVATIISLISEGHRFTPSQWPVWDNNTENNLSEGLPDEGVSQMPTHEGVTHEIPSSQNLPVPRKPFTRSAKRVRDTKRKAANAQKNTYVPGPGASAFVAHSDLLHMKSWIVGQLDSLRTNIITDIQKMLGINSVSTDHQSPLPKTANDETNKDDEHVCRKRKQSDSQALSGSRSKLLSSEEDVGGSSHPGAEIFANYGATESIISDINRHTAQVCFKL